jgi:hypothetical protein
LIFFLLHHPYILNYTPRIKRIRWGKKMIKKFIWRTLLCTITFAQADHSGVIIIVHGTWGIDSPWCKPGGDFFDALEKSAKHFNKKVISYMWPGYLIHESRKLAAQGLVKVIKSYPEDMIITLVAHSHGGNVSILASQILATDPHNKHTIDSLYAIATPVNVAFYKPNMNIIKKLYNLFSFADRVQPVLGIFGRTFPDHPRIANMRLVLDGKEPGHIEFCTELMAQWLPYIHEKLDQENIGKFQYFNFKLPGIIYLNSNANPLYSVDVQRQALLEKDRIIMEEISNAMARKNKLINDANQLL